MSDLPQVPRPGRLLHTRPRRHLALIVAEVVDLGAYRRARARAGRLRLRVATSAPPAPRCPGCARRVLAQRPGYWRAGWGLPAALGCHPDRSALCIDPVTDAPYPYPRPALRLVTP